MPAYPGIPGISLEPTCGPPCPLAGPATISGGENISTIEVETAIGRHLDVASGTPLRAMPLADDSIAYP